MTADSQPQLHCFTGGVHEQNAYVLTSNGRCAVIDPGHSATRIIDLVTELGAQVDYILLTHAHFDHVMDAAELARHFGVAVRVHHADNRLLRRAPLYAMLFMKTRMQEPKDIRELESHPLHLGDHSVEFVHTPGHTAGSVCFRCGSLVFTGDTLMRDCVGRTDFPESNADHLVSSIDRLLAWIDGPAELHPGHGASWTVADARAWWSQHQSTHSLASIPVAHND
jgi:hydroxyacylglutathione hydrolase